MACLMDISWWLVSAENDIEADHSWREVKDLENLEKLLVAHTQGILQNMDMTSAAESVDFYILCETCITYMSLLHADIAYSSFKKDWTSLLLLWHWPLPT